MNSTSTATAAMNSTVTAAMNSTSALTAGMDEPTKVEEHLAVWADVLSFILLAIVIFIAGGVDPRRRVWGRSPIRNTCLTLALTFNLLFSIGRFVAEGILVETGPREFLLISVIYCARWIWLYVGISKSGSLSAKAFEVAQALTKLKMIRFGKSSKPERRGEPELVIRRGERVVRAKGDHYWRGVEESAKQFEEVGGTWMVRLVEKELHAKKLDEIGTVEFKRKIETLPSDGLYKKFYDVIMTAYSSHPKLRVDFTPFLEEFEEVSSTTGQARSVGATDDSDLGKVARRVAADACYYIWHDGPTIELRTPKHVEVINKCIEDAAKKHLRDDSNV